MIGEDLDEKFKNEVDRKGEGIQENKTMKMMMISWMTKLEKRRQKLPYSYCTKIKLQDQTTFIESYFRKEVRHLSKQ